MSHTIAVVGARSNAQVTFEDDAEMLMAASNHLSEMVHDKLARYLTLELPRPPKAGGEVPRSPSKASGEVPRSPSKASATATTDDPLVLSM